MAGQSTPRTARCTSPQPRARPGRSRSLENQLAWESNSPITRHQDKQSKPLGARGDLPPDWVSQVNCSRNALISFCNITVTCAYNRAQVRQLVPYGEHSMSQNPASSSQDDPSQVEDSVGLRRIAHDLPDPSARFTNRAGNNAYWEVMRQPETQEVHARLARESNEREQAIQERVTRNIEREAYGEHLQLEIAHHNEIEQRFNEIEQRFSELKPGNKERHEAILDEAERAYKNTYATKDTLRIAFEASRASYRQVYGAKSSFGKIGAESPTRDAFNHAIASTKHMNNAYLMGEVLYESEQVKKSLGDDISGGVFLKDEIIQHQQTDPSYRFDNGEFRVRQGSELAARQSRFNYRRDWSRQERTLQLRDVAATVRHIEYQAHTEQYISNRHSQSSVPLPTIQEATSTPIDYTAASLTTNSRPPSYASNESSTQSRRPSLRR